MRINDCEIYQDDLKTSFEHVVDSNKIYKKIVMITGATGTIGSFIVDTLMRANRDKGSDITVVACGRSKSKLRDRFDFWKNEEKKGLLIYATLDILDDKLVDILEDDLGKDIAIDCVIHAAGNAYPSAFIDHSEETVKGNILGTKRLIDFAAKYGCKRFVYVSSGEAVSVKPEDEKVIMELYEKTAGNNLYDDYYREVLKLVVSKGARYCYPISKVAAEKMCLEKNDCNYSDISFLVVRPCHTFGPGITGDDDRAHVQFAQKAVHKENIILNSAGSQLRSYNYVADAASAILSVLSSGNKETIYDICSKDNVITIKGLAEIIGEVSNVQVVVNAPDERDAILQSPIKRQVLDASKLIELGWSSAFDIKSGVRHYIEILNYVGENKHGI